MMRRGCGRAVLGFWCAMFLTAPFAFAQAQKPSSKMYVLKAARLFDGKSDALLKPGLLIVTGGKITGVGAGTSIPAGAEVIDFGDATLLPGFIDAHTQRLAWEPMLQSTRMDAIQKSFT